MLSSTATMLTLTTEWPSDSTTSTRRSCVMGRGGTTPCWARAMALASGVPIQIGTWRSPCISRRRTSSCLEGTKVPRLESVAFQLHTGARHLEGVLVKLSVGVADQPEAQQGLEQRDAGAGLRPQLFLGELAPPALQFRSEFIGDDPRGDHD